MTGVCFNRIFKKTADMDVIEFGDYVIHKGSIPANGGLKMYVSAVDYEAQTAVVTYIDTDGSLKEESLPLSDLEFVEQTDNTQA